VAILQVHDGGHEDELLWRTTMMGVMMDDFDGEV
jgi:hypothetical protein